MVWKNSSARYGTLSIALHWLMLLLIIAVYACIELRSEFPRGSALRDALKTWHFMLGLAVFVLVWIRLVVRLAGPVPDIVPQPSKLQLRIAHTLEYTIYAFMIAMPLLGWLILSAEQKPVPFFGMQLPPLIGADKELADQLEDIHEAIGTAGYFLIGLHAAAALIHHYIRRDNTLTRILPAR